ncbi:MAG TPA: transporter [Verrucomicrobiae bacterium]|nr:transporter [Verrucomicrobiae bacterium]
MKTDKPYRFLLASVSALTVSAMAAFNSPAQDVRSELQPLSVEPTKDAAPASADATDQEADLAKKLQNPVAALISVPLQNNWDFGIGPANAMKYTCNIQPVVPISISEDWNLILRTILPVIYQEALVNNPKAPNGLGESHAGLGDTTQSFFFSPKAPVDGWILGAGPVGFYPTATEEELGSGKWGAGPTIVALQQQHGFTYGILANQIWSFAGQQDRVEVNATYLQPFVSFTTKTYTTFAVNTETTYDWEANQATVPMNFMVQQLVKIGKLPVAFQAGYRYYVNKPDGGPDWGLRFTVTFLFPKK